MGKRSAQARRAEGVRDQSRMAATRHEARGAAREPDGSNRDEKLARQVTPSRLEKTKGVTDDDSHPAPGNKTGKS